MAAINVDYAVIHAAGEDCDKTAKALDGYFEELKDRLAPLIASWGGEGSIAWKTMQDKWDVASRDMQSLLARIAIALPQMADGYQSTDKGINNMFAG